VLPAARGLEAEKAALQTKKKIPEAQGQPKQKAESSDPALNHPSKQRQHLT